MTFDFKPIIARVLAAVIAWLAAKAAAHGVTIDVSPETQMALVLMIYGTLHNLSKQIFRKKVEG